MSTNALKYFPFSTGMSNWTSFREIPKPQGSGALLKNLREITTMRENTQHISVSVGTWNKHVSTWLPQKYILENAGSFMNILPVLAY